MQQRSWNELWTELAAFHPQARPVTGGARFVLELGPIRVGLYVGPTDAGKIAILGEVATIGTLDPIELLEWNAALDSATIAIIGDAIVVRSVVDIACAVDEIEHRIQLVARVVGAIKRSLRRPHQPTLFAHYAH